MLCRCNCLQLPGLLLIAPGKVPPTCLYLPVGTPRPMRPTACAHPPHHCVYPLQAGTRPWLSPKRAPELARTAPRPPKTPPTTPRLVRHFRTAATATGRAQLSAVSRLSRDGRQKPGVCCLSCLILFFSSPQWIQPRSSANNSASRQVLFDSCTCLFSYIACPCPSPAEALGPVRPVACLPSSTALSTLCRPSPFAHLSRR